MCGRGIDRHLFALYVVQRYLEEDSALLRKIIPPTYQLSTSQTPMSQCDHEVTNELQLNATKRFNMITAGGGFGPVADRGYGVSYIIAGEKQISFHISSKRSADNTVRLLVAENSMLLSICTFFRAQFNFAKTLSRVCATCTRYSKKPTHLSERAKAAASTAIRYSAKKAQTKAL